ncbi:MAG: FeoB small GTPase domain-containing protein, partial [Bacillota bacterium]
MRILLMGNPNVGKSAVFSRLTGTQVIISNYSGTTVEFTKGSTVLRAGETAEVIDVPGTYSLEATSKAEEVAVDMLDGMLDEGDIVVNVVDATHLERNLYLTLQLLERNVPVVVALNLWDETKHKGISINVDRLQEILGVPVIPTSALTGEGIDVLVNRISEVAKDASGKRKLSGDGKRPGARSADERWAEIGRILAEVQKITHRHHTFLDRLEDASIQPVTGLIIAILVLYLSFKTVRLIGEGLI